MAEIYNSADMMFVQFKNYLYHENVTHPPHIDTSSFFQNVNHPGYTVLYPIIIQAIRTDTRQHDTTRKQVCIQSTIHILIH